MILIFLISVGVTEGILHVCGDDPILTTQRDQMEPVFSTYVEMILINLIVEVSLESILHVCGDDPLRHLKLLRLF